MNNQYKKNKRDIRDIRVSIRLNEEEKAFLEKKAAMNNVDLSKYIRAVLLRKETTLLNPIPEVNRDLIKQVRKIGGNINQIAYRVNVKKSSAGEEYNFSKELKEMKRILKEIIDELTKKRVGG